PRAAASRPAALFNHMTTKAPFSQVPQLRAHARFRIAGRTSDLLQRTPSAVGYEGIDSTDLPTQSIVIERGIVNGAVESGRFKEAERVHLPSASALGSAAWLEAASRAACSLTIALKSASSSVDKRPLKRF